MQNDRIFKWYALGEEFKRIQHLLFITEYAETMLLYNFFFSFLLLLLRIQYKHMQSDRRTNEREKRSEKVKRAKSALQKLFIAVIMKQRKRKKKIITLIYQHITRYNHLCAIHTGVSG